MFGRLDSRAVSHSALIIGDARPWVQASVAAILHSITSTLSLHDLIDTTLCHFELCIEQKNVKILQRYFLSTSRNLKILNLKRLVMNQLHTSTSTSARFLSADFYSSQRSRMTHLKS